MTRKLLALAATAALLATARLGAQDLPNAQHEPSALDPFCFAVGSGPQSCSFNIPVHLTVPHLLEMWTDDIAFTDLGDIGWGKWVVGPKIYAYANTDWDITVKAATPNFSGPGTKSASTLYVYVQDPFRLESVNNAVTLATGGMGYTALGEFNLYSFTDAYNDSPGDYSIDLVYTMTGR